MSLKDKALEVPRQERELKRLRKRLAYQERLLASQQERIEQLTKSKFTIPAARKASAPKNSFTRVIIPDTHGCFIDPDAAGIFLRDLENLAPKEIVLIGDHIDCGGFLAQHLTMGYVAEADYSFEQDVIAANTFLDQVQQRCPTANYYYLEGNHERRIEKWITTQTQRNGHDAAYLHQLFSVEVVLNLEQRGIPLFKQGQFYDGCRIPATIKLGHCYFTHGSRHGRRAADAMLQRFGAPVVFGHVHKLLATSDRNVKDGELGAWCVGYLGRLQPLWKHTDPTDWTHGYGVQLCRADGDFLHLNVPIIDGKSYLVQLMR